MTEELARLVAMLFVLAFFLSVMVAFAKIFSKAGYSKWLCLTVYVPLVNFVVLWWFALSTWPIEAEARRLRAVQPRSIQV